MMNHGDVTGSGRHDLDIWTVRLATGETRTLSLDDLAEAFNEGWIDERTPVLRAGAIRWATLGEVAGLDDLQPPESMPNSIAPLALDARFELDVPIDVESDPDVQAFRPRRGRKIFAALTAMVVVAGLGVAAFRGRPLLQRALASSGATKTTPVAVAPASPPPAQPVQVQAPAPAPAPAAAPTIATLNASALPNAPQTAADKKAAAEAEKKAAKAKRKR